MAYIERYTRFYKYIAGIVWSKVDDNITNVKQAINIAQKNIPIILQHFNDNINLQEKQKPTGQPGYCKHFFAHRGIGLITQKTQNWQYLKTLFPGQSNIPYFGCGPTKKIALKEYKNAENNYKITRRKKRLSKN